jgi:hypothetical protein
VITTIRERLPLKKGMKLHLVVDGYNLNKLLGHETRNEYQIDVANRYLVFKGLEISSVDDTWVTIRDSIKASAEERIGNLETYQNKSLFNQECSILANKRKQLILLCLKTADFTNVRRDNCRTFKKKKCDYMKAKVNKLEDFSNKKIFGKGIWVLMNSRRAINLTLM